MEYGHRPDEDDTPHMFVWRMTFQPGETRHLTVSYNLPISALVGDTWKQNADRDGFDNPWYRRFSGAMIEMFSYITVTGKTWARNIENATFRLKPEGFEQYLSRRPMDETASSESGSRNEWKKRVVPHVHREVTPKNYEQKDGDLVWTYDDFTPGPTIRVKYFLIAIPSRLRDWKGYFEHSDESLSETDAEIITGFYKALHGIPPSNDMVKSFVQQQVWYEKKPKEERSLDESQQEIIDFILKHVKDQ